MPSSTYTSTSRGSEGTLISYADFGAARPSKSNAGRRHGDYHRAVKQPTYERNPTSQVGTRVSRSSKGPGRIDVEDMPPSNYFSSGASREDSARWQQGYSTQYLGSRQSRSKAYSAGAKPSYEPYRGNYDDTCSVAPDDSISVFSSSASRHSKGSRRSGGSVGGFQDATSANVERDPVYGASEVGIRRLSNRGKAYGGCGDEGWGPDEQPYYDEANGCYVRNVRPDCTR